LTRVLEVLLLCASALLIVPVVVLLAEVLLAVVSRRRNAPQEGARPRVAVLVPAHDESAVIGGTIRSIASQLEDGDTLLVVADNCSDETAVIALAAGAEVITRTDANHRGKGYALDFGVRHLQAIPPDVLIIIDADCQVDPGSIDRLARRCVGVRRPLQALDLMQVTESPALQARVTQFAWLVKNQVRPLGLHSVGLPCQLMGTGMAFPWSCIANAALATGSIVEDMKLGIDLARAGTPPQFCPEARVTSVFPALPAGVREQRTRWEHGHLGTILSEVPRLLLGSIAGASPQLLALALDLSVPPLALLSLLVGAVWSGSVLLYFFTRQALALALATIALGMLLMAVLLAWARYGRRILSPGDLALSVVYPLAKLPLYARFLFARQKRWVRSARGRDGS
jgi:cellulose synthase/poly-beta-1,6-N-acetylglucosamine synthase-like glycosyltransferase